MLILMGVAGIGAVWGWTAALFYRRGHRKLWNGLILAAATLAAGPVIYLLAGWPALPAFPAAALVFFTLYTAWNGKQVHGGT